MKKNTRACIHAFTGSMRRLAYFLLLFGSLASPVARAAYLPPVTVTGKVTDARNAPLEGVSVLVKGTRKGVTTSASGAFTITNVPENAVIVFSSTGFESREVALHGQTSLNVSLTETVSGLSDVVVVGYGTSTKKDLTGAVSQVKATTFENENPRSVGDLLRGNAPGLDVGFDASTKGSNSSLQVRGKGTLTASSSPLIVLDGVIYTGGLEDINPNDIGTIDILKDASSAAVFGARSANGVILITTKKGKVGKPTITFNDNIGYNKVERKPHLLTGPEFLDFRSQAVFAMAGFDSTSKPGVQYKFTNPANLPSSITVAQWQALDNSTGDPVITWLSRLKLKAVEIANYQAGKVLNWEDLLYNRSAMQHDHTISISQRRDDYNYYFSVGYLENQGITVGDKYKTIRTRLNLEANVAKYLTVGVNFQFAERDESTIPVNFSDVQQTTPYGSIFQDDGVTLRVSPNDDPGNNTNPFMGQYYQKRLYKYDNLFSQFSVKGKLPYGFSYSIAFSPRFDILREYNHISSKQPLLASLGGVIDRRNQNVFSWNLDNILRWNGKFGKHTIEATFLVNAEKFQSYNQTSHGETILPNDNLGYDAIGSATNAVRTSSDDQYETGDALMGRVAYNYNQRYFLTATMRRDGYSAFGQKNPRATFPSIGGAWAISEEKFMKNTSRWLDYAKIRLSYGENGNRSIGRYAALSNLASNTYVFVTSGGTVYNTAQVYSSNLSNPELKWERNNSIDLGLDFSLFKGRVSGAVEYYTRSTKDLLVNRSLPTVTGFNSILANLGQVDNRGFELSLSTLNIKRANFEWNTTFAFWLNRNKIVHLYGATPDYDATGKQIGVSEKNDLSNGWFIGQDISTIYDYKVVGVWGTAEAAQAKAYGFKPGDFKLEDLNGDGAYTIADKQFLGTRTPKFSMNMRNEFRFGNWNFSFTLYGKFGQKYVFNESKNVDKFYDRSNFYQRPYWTPTNQIQDYAAINSNAGGPVSWNVFKTSTFVRISNMSLAYTFPNALMSRWKMQGLKLYFNVVNAAVFSGWNYFDPEYKGPDPNSPRNDAPVPLNLNFGVNLTL